MSPKIYYSGGDLIADVLDETGTYELPDGSLLYVNTDAIDAAKDVSMITLEAEQIGGRRTIGLMPKGEGTSNNPKTGDMLNPAIHVQLNDKPIREVRRELVRVERVVHGYGIRTQAIHNPRWVRGHERE